MNGDARPRLYRIRVRGALGRTLLAAFPSLEAETHNGETLLSATLDQAALHGVLAEIESLGLELLEVQSVARPPA